MKTITTINGQDVTLYRISMTRKGGYGQYNINIQFGWDGQTFETNIHSTDSRSFDNMNEADDSIEFLCEEFKNTINDVVSDLISESVAKSN